MTIDFASSTPVLLQIKNPNAKIRGPYRGHFYLPDQRRGVTAVVVHTTESAADTTGPDGGAEAVARWQTTAPHVGSYHAIADSDSLVRTLPDGFVAFHVAATINGRSANRWTLGISFAARTSVWTSDPSWAVAALQHAAKQTAEWCHTYQIPARHITRAEFGAGTRGIIGHGELQPADRSDPGPAFPWDGFLTLVADNLAGMAGSPPVLPRPVISTAAPSRAPLLRQGSAGDTVRELQRLLNEHGSGELLEIDGQFGPLTGAAVRACQQAAGVMVDGIVGPVTWAALNRHATPKGAGPTAADLPGVVVGPVAVGGQVTVIQRFLASKSAAAGDRALNPGAVDGVYGTATTAAVMAWQEKVGSVPDGIWGPNTLAATRRAG